MGGRVGTHKYKQNVNVHVSLILYTYTSILPGELGGFTAQVSTEIKSWESVVDREVLFVK